MTGLSYANRTPPLQKKNPGLRAPVHAAKVRQTRNAGGEGGGDGGGVLTADFHAAECRGLRHWFAALREGCGPGPTRHDPIPSVLSRSSSLSLSLSLDLGDCDLLIGSTGRLSEPSHPKEG